jgi:DNA-binding NarL/FixJ family response regulator
MLRDTSTETMPPMGATLLIVDDHDGFRRFARAVLEAEGFDVVGEASTGFAGITAAAELRPDVVLLDVMLPDLDGFAVCERMTIDDVALDVVLMSSRDVSNYRQSLERSKARGFIPKGELSGAAVTALLGE